ncbi:MAG: hypothetical protein Q8P20_00575 [bacterium]|nr:hypothetical protein [bacterium]
MVKKDTKQSQQNDEGDLIWEELRNLPIEMFALPNQRVEDHILRVKGVPGKLYVKARSSAVLPALEILLNGQKAIEKEGPTNVSYPKYEMVESEMYIEIKRFVRLKSTPQLKAVPEVVDGTTMLRVKD